MTDIDQVVGRMDLDRKVGQLFTLGFCGTTMTPEVREMILDLHVGGLRITPNVYLDYAVYQKLVNDRSEKKGDPIPSLAPFLTPIEFAALLNDVQEMAVARQPGLPLHISVDVSNVSRGGYPFFPAPMGFTCADDPDLFRACMELYAACMRATGVNMIHYPCVDVVRQPESPEINTGSFSGDPNVVAAYAEIMIQAFASKNVIATGKHFPGRGYSTKDAHYTVDVCPLSYDELMQIDLTPYKRMIAKGLPAIMTAHSSYPHLAKDEHPATISPGILHAIIRKELGFEGVVTTDSITMQGIKKLMPTHEACARAIQAGSDLILYKTLAPDDAALAMKTVKDWVRQGKIPEERIDESVRRVLTMKNKIGLLDDRNWRTDPTTLTTLLQSEPVKQLPRQAARAAALVIRDRTHVLPLAPHTRILVVEQRMFTSMYTNDGPYHPYMLWESVARRFPDAGLVRLEFFGNNQKLEEIEKKLERYDLIVATNYYSRGAATNTQFLDQLSKLTSKDIVVLTDSPFPAVVADHMDTVVCLFSEAPAALDTAVEILHGDFIPKTTMPVDYIRY